MNKHLKKLFTLSTLTLALSGCGFFDTDNTPPPSPLTSFTTELKVKHLWSRSSGFGVSDEFLKLNPVIEGSTVFVSNKNGYISATHKDTGKSLWETNTKLELSTGPGVADNKVFAASRNGEVIALNQADGKILWTSKVSSEVLAPPAAGKNIVIIKSIDGKLTGLSQEDGHVLWVSSSQTEPTLILRAASAPQISSDAAVIGFANGNLAKFTLKNGDMLWQQTVAQPDGLFAIQRMVDIDADPIIYHHKVYAATYQGKVGSFNLATGTPYWVKDISSYAGIAADDSQVFVSDAKSVVTAFNADNGETLWRQTKLEARNVTGPVVINNYVVIGDEEGYLHWLDKKDGHFVARTKVGGNGILANPVVSGNILYVVTKNGRLAAYRPS